MTKLLIEIYHTYGKGDGEELYSSNVEEYYPELRQHLVEEHEYWECYDNKEDFINGKQDTINFERYDGDWDDPTGATIVIKTYKQKLEEIKREYEEAIEKLDKQFIGGEGK